MTPEIHQSARELLRRAREGDAEAREALVRENLALVKYLVRRFLGRGAEYDDLFQYGCMGLLKAIDRFDPDYPVRFSTYAVPVILGEIRRFLRDDGPIHISRTIHDQARRVERYLSDAEAAGRSPSVEEIAGALEMDRGDVLLALNSRRPLRSLDEPLGNDSEARLMDVIGSEPMAKVDRKLLLGGLLKALDEKERDLILRRYFKGHTQSRIAQDIGTSQVQVSRMEARILRKLREMLE